MTIEQKKNGSALSLALKGRLDTSTAPQLEAELKTALDGEYARKLSFRMDCRCFFGTFLSVLRSDGVVEGGTGELNRQKDEVKR